MTSMQRAPAGSRITLDDGAQIEETTPGCDRQNLYVDHRLDGFLERVESAEDDRPNGYYYYQSAGRAGFILAWEGTLDMGRIEAQLALTELLQPPPPETDEGQVDSEAPGYVHPM